MWNCSTGKTMKLHLDGGLKLVDIKMKSYTLKIKCLMEMCVEQKLSIHLNLFTQLLGPEKSQIQGKDLFFVPTYYVDMSLNTFCILQRSHKSNVDIKPKKSYTGSLKKTCLLQQSDNDTKILDEVRKRQDGEPYSKKHTNL